MKQPRVPKRYASAFAYDFWQETSAGSAQYSRVAGNGSMDRIWRDYAARNLGPSWIITARLKEADKPSLDNIVARS